MQTAAIFNESLLGFADAEDKVSDRLWMEATVNRGATSTDWTATFVIRNLTTDTLVLAWNRSGGLDAAGRFFLDDTAALSARIRLDEPTVDLQVSNRVIDRFTASSIPPNSSSAAVAIDADGDGMCDVCQARYHAQGLVADEDSDGDGQDNRSEAIAGTDPFDARSVFSARIIGADETVAVSVVTRPGKRYQLFHAPLPNGPWTTAGVPEVSSGEELVLSAPSFGERHFYRVAVTDADSDGDGVSDWAEMQLAGFDPTKPTVLGFPAAIWRPSTTGSHNLKAASLLPRSRRPLPTKKRPRPPW